jgi:hypothetical protein
MQDRYLNMLRKYQHLIWATLYFVVMSLIITWPLAKYMSHSVVGSVGDNIYFVWLIKWFQKALIELHVSPLYVPFLNYPQGWYLAYTDITPAMVFLGLPAGILGGATYGYNFAMLASFVLSGIGMYIWVKKLTGSSVAGIISGTAFAFSPYRMAHYLIGHLSLAGTQWFPFYFMGLTELIQRKDFSWKPILLTAISLGLIGLTSIYYLYMTLLLSVVIVVGAWILFNHKLLRDRQFWKGLGLSILCSAPLLAIGIYPYLKVFQLGGMPDRPVSYVSMYSASPTDFILPSTQHFLVGEWIGYHFDRSLWIEATLYIGFIVGCLALLAFILQKKIPQRNLVNLLVLSSIVAFILALGTNLHWLNRPVEQIPEFISRWLSQPDAAIPLPGYLLFKFLPFYSKMRVWMRFGIFVILFVDVLAGIGSAWLLAKLKTPWRGVVAVGLICLVILDFYPEPMKEYFRVQDRPIDAWLAEQPGDGAVVQFPFQLVEDQDQAYSTLSYNKPFLGGFFNAFPPEQYQRIRPILMNFPNQESVDLLKELSVQYVLVDSSYYPDFNQTREEIERLGLRQRTEIGSEFVYELSSR